MKQPLHPYPAVSEVQRLLRYEPETGHLYWRVSRGSVKAGKRATCLDGRGYICIKIFGRNYHGHIVAWALMTGEWPSTEIDHRDLNGTNNIWTNLRLATRGQNAANVPAKKNKAHPLKGAFLDKRDGMWFSLVEHKGVRHYLGRFSTPEEAHAAYAVAAKRIHGEYARSA